LATKDAPGCGSWHHAHRWKGCPAISERVGKEEAVYMPHFVLLVNWTDQGIRNVKETIQRVEAADALEQKHGLRLEQIYWTVGPYDIVAIGEAPDDESATAFALELGSAGNVRTTTLRAYDREEMSGIIQRLG
jgi:uncharacterized protein with GYD domain